MQLTVEQSQHPFNSTILRLLYNIDMRWNFHKLLSLLIVTALLSSACQALAFPIKTVRLTPSILPALASTPTPTLATVPTNTPAPATSQPTTEPGATAALSPTVSTPPEIPPAVVIHPEGKLYVGDQVSFEVLPPRSGAAVNPYVQLSLAGPSQAHTLTMHPLAKQQFVPFGIGGRMEAALTWAWDTRGLAPGDYDLVFSIQPGGPSWTQTLTLQPASSLPLAEQGAQWALARNTCCAIHYITHTEAERDMPKLLKDLDAQAADAAARMGVQFTRPVTITLMPRLLGQGGFADESISVSYLDRDYTAGDIERIIHHEMIHILDSRLKGDLRVSLLQEGLAVYQSGGHFKAEPFMPRAAALLDHFGSPAIDGLNWYIPLSRLVNQFYLSQHEVGYLEGASLIEYMVKRWGWQQFLNFYLDVHLGQSGGQATALDNALELHFNLTLAQLESAFIDALRAEPASADWREDVRLTVEFYDTMRRYQQLLDPSAYFLSAWLPDQAQMRERGIVADFMRHPSAPLNLALETMLGAASRDLQAGHLAAVRDLLQAIDAALDAVDGGEAAPLKAHPLAVEYGKLVDVIGAAGYDLQRLEINTDTANAWVREGIDGLRQIVLNRAANGGWQISP